MAIAGYNPREFPALVENMSSYEAFGRSRIKSSGVMDTTRIKSLEQVMDTAVTVYEYVR